MSYYPKGSMCMNCKARLNNCSELPFYLMPVIEINTGIIGADGQPGKIVKCSNFSKAAIESAGVRVK